jgi:BirA family transcriptional regulator, biotin operon repressor / biotin---[acetyl-CoA-carboxylase] ligase
MVAGAVEAALAHPGRWRVHHLISTRSTNDDLARGSGLLTDPVDGTVLVTEVQTAGRGRSGRDWSCPAGAGLMFSIKVDAAAIPSQRRAWMGVALGLAVTSAFRAATGFTHPVDLTAMLKWPNDVLVEGSKCGGILAESVGESVVVGAGLNISLDRAELPRPDATSLALAGVEDVDRNQLLAAILDRFGELLDSWQAAGGDVDAGGLRPSYLAACATLGQQVRVELPGGGHVQGTAIDVDPDGAIVIEQPAGRFRYSAGDVVHLRPLLPQV